MIKSWLKRRWNGRPALWLLLGALLLWSVEGSLLKAADPPPAPPQGQAQAAKKLARKAAARPTGSQSAPSKEADASQVPSPQAVGPGESGRRDPFDIPKPEKSGGQVASGQGLPGEPGVRPAGKRGLVIGQLSLEGIVNQKATNAMIAVVTTPESRAAFFLRENDELYNGVVSKITRDSIYFTENARNLAGQMASRQVIKKLGSGPGEK
jgi:hypothetical protein